MATETSLITPPHSKESEMMVIGCVMNNIDNLNIVAESLDESDFYFSEHRLIFLAMKRAYKEEKPVDVHLIAEALKREKKLKAVGGVDYIASLAQYAGTSSNVEEYVQTIKDKSSARDLLLALKDHIKKAQDDPDNFNNQIEELSSKIKSIENQTGRKIPVIEPKEHLAREHAFLKSYRGKQYLGLRVETIREFNENLLGLRGLMLLAAAPNVGKTALTIQIGLEVLRTEKDACLVYVSLEMSKEQIFRRMMLNLSNLNFGSYVFGTQAQGHIDSEERYVFFKEEEAAAIKAAEEELLLFGKRLQIIDQTICPSITAKAVINHVKQVKEDTGASRAIVVIDYLQVWPMDSSSRSYSENEADKWRIGEMKKIRDGLNDDPVVVISEARKPNQNDNEWGGDLSDVMGSARGTYTPDVVLLFSQLQPQAIKILWDSKQMPSIPPDQEHEHTDKKDKDGAAIISFLAKNGISICRLKAPKCRDGMKRFNTLILFHFNKNKFTQVTWQEIKKLVQKSSQR